MASDDEEQMQGLFGSESESDGEKQPHFVKSKQAGRRVQAGSDEDGDGAQPRSGEGLEDEEAEEDGRAAGAASGSEEEEERAADNRYRQARVRNGPAMPIAAPLIPIPASHTLHRLKLSNIIGLDPTPFEPETFVEEEEIIVDESGKKRVKLKDQAVIRWRYARGPDGQLILGPDGQPVTESNARFVRWSDGSLQMILGDEVLDVVITEDQFKNEFLFCISGVIQGQAPLTSRLGFRPATVNSKLHKRLREEVDKRHGLKAQKVAKTADLYDPVKESQRREKMIDESLNLAARQDRVMRRAGGGGGGGLRGAAGARGGARGRQQLNTQFLEEDDAEYAGDDGFIDDDDVGAAGRRRHMDDAEEEEAARRLQSAKRNPPPAAAAAGGKRGRVAESDQEDDDDEDEAEYEESEEEGDEESEEEEEEEEERAAPRGTRPTAPPGRDARGGGSKPTPPPAAAPKAKARRGVVLSDDDD